MTVVVAADPFEILRRQVLCHPFGDHDRAVFAAFAFAGQHHVDHAINHSVERHHFARLAGLLVDHFLSASEPEMSSTLSTMLASPAIAAP